MSDEPTPLPIDLSLFVVTYRTDPETHSFWFAHGWDGRGEFFRDGVSIGAVNIENVRKVERVVETERLGGSEELEDEPLPVGTSPTAGIPGLLEPKGAWRQFVQPVTEEAEGEAP